MKTKAIVPALLLLFSALFQTACEDVLGVKGKGDKITETRDVDNFHALEISANGQVDLRVDSVFRVEVTCEESIIDFLETVEDDGVLKIYFDRDVYDVDGLRIRVSAPNWDAIETSGSIDLDAPDAISGDRLRVNLSGSGNLRFFDVDFQEIDAQTSGSANLFLTGQAESLDVTISGSGNTDALDCPVQNAKVTISGSGSARLDVSELLEVTISGSGDVEYKGSPQVNSQISGSGSVRKI